jgi:pyruvate dehydrogenase E2 component (dihydrolipoamide acetyltransferase)
MTITQTMERMAELVRRARAGHLRSSDIREPTITVSSLGDQGADEVLGVIYPPQVALVGYGRVAERAWAESGMLGTRRAVTASIAGDHRVSDGHEASRFLALIDQFVQEPQSLEG